MEQAVIDAIDSRRHVVVFFDVSVGGSILGRICMEMYNDLTPKTCEKFRQFCTGEYRRDGLPIGYKGCRFHHIDHRTGQIIGGSFQDHDAYSLADASETNAGVKQEEFHLATCGTGYGCEFVINTRPGLVPKGIVFGRILPNCKESEETLRKLSQVSIKNYACGIEECGQL